MKKMKKLFAVLLTLAMVLGMSMTSFAADPEATVTIRNAGNATFTYTQVIKADTKQPTGWTFTSTAIADAYKSAYNSNNEQAVIKAMIAEAKAGGASSKAADALRRVKAITDLTKTPANATAVTGTNDSTFTLSEAGVYYIEGTDTTDGYTFNPMSAYIAFKDYDTKTGLPTNLENTTVEAKKQKDTAGKTVNDNIVEIGRTVTYTADYVIPYISADAADANKVFKVTDTITGADYVTSANNTVTVKAWINKTVDNVKAGSAGAPDITGSATLSNNNKTFTWIMTNESYGDSTLINAANSNANKTIVIQYDAIVKDTKVHNDVTFGDGSHEGSASVDVYTGTINLSKKGENNVALENAKFVLAKKFNNVEKYATFTPQDDGSYKFTGTWADSYKKADKSFVTNTIITTDANGTAKMKGFENTETVYYLKEVEAPDGYSLADDKVIEWSEVNGTPSETNVNANVTVVDSKLSALPSTGGIGTTIFTIAGCVIMIAAAGLFFASRKKSDNK